MKKRILLITTVYRTGEKIYPILEPLASEYTVDVFHLFQMSSKTPWQGEIDSRLSFYDRCSKCCERIVNGPMFEREKNAENYEPFIRDFDKLFDKNSIPNLVIADNNITIRGGYTTDIYRWFHSRNIPVIACPHGNRNYKGYKVLKHIGSQYDYSFVFGKKDRDGLAKAEPKRAKHKKYLLLGGIPSNDRLKDYKRDKKYVLILTNYTDSRYIKRQTKGLHPFTKKIFDDLHILGLADKYGCPIVIKEKNKREEFSTLLKDSLQHKDVSFIRDAVDDNKLIAEAACVVSAVSTIAFKPIQIGVPTVVLRKHGLLGNFVDFPGLIDEGDRKAMMRALEHQEKNGRYEDFIKNTLAGGWDFTSTDKYISNIKSIIEK